MRAHVRSHLNIQQPRERGREQNSPERRKHSSKKSKNKTPEVRVPAYIKCASDTLDAQTHGWVPDKETTAAE